MVTHHSSEQPAAWSVVALRRDSCAWAQLFPRGLGLESFRCNRGLQPVSLWRTLAPRRNCHYGDLLTLSLRRRQRSVRRSQRPFHTGLRFSEKARAPSFRSSERSTFCTAARLSWSSNAGCSATTSVWRSSYLMAGKRSGGPSASCRAISRALINACPFGTTWLASPQCLASAASIQRPVMRNSTAT